MTVVGIRESERVIGWAITRINSERKIKYDYAVKQIPNRPYVAVSANQEALNALYGELTRGGCDNFKVGNLRPHEIAAAGF